MFRLQCARPDLAEHDAQVDVVVEAQRQTMLGTRICVRLQHVDDTCDNELADVRLVAVVTSRRGY